MNKLTKSGVICTLAGLLIVIAGIGYDVLDGRQDQIFSWGIFLTLFVGLPLIGFGLILAIASAAHRVWRRQNDSSVNQPVAAKSLAMRWYLGAAGALVLSILEDTLSLGSMAMSGGENLALGLIKMAFLSPLSIIGMMGPLIAIVMAIIGAGKANTQAVKGIAIAILVAALAVYSVTLG